MKKLFNKYKVQFKLIFALTLGLVVLSIVYYFLIPAILNYPKNTYGTSFQMELENTNYLSQVLLISLSIFSIFSILTFAKTQFLIKYHNIFNTPEKYSIKDINYVRNKLFTTPYLLLLYNITIPSIALTAIHAYTIKHFGITTLKLFILVLSLMTLYVTSVFIYTSNIFKKLLLKLPYSDNLKIKKTYIENRIIYNILPLITVSILFTSLIGYSLLSIKTGDSLFETYHNSLYYFKEYNTFSSFEDLLNKAKGINLINNNDFIFIKNDNNKYFDLNGKDIEISKFFDKYLNELSGENNGRVYEYYGIDCQGATIDIKINGTNYTIGVYYYIVSNNILIYFLITFLVLVLINIIILLLFSKNLSNDINIISSSFLDITKGNDVSKMQPLAITSNDEFCDLIIAFNKIQQLTKKNIEQIESNQDMLMEQERLASLGQLIGGISHNLKTPIMSISGAAEGLNDLIKEYEASVGDPEVTVQDHHDIAKDMYTWTEKIKSYTEYMSDIITTVKGQAVTLSSENDVDFTIDELIKRVDILMKHELKNALITLNTNINIDPGTTLDGDVNSLVQVVNNLIQNAIQAYGGEPNKEINLNVTKENKNIIIAIQDFGMGMSDEIKNKLFKEMITTKGKNGSGLGLFMSYSTIKAHFKGDLTFETEQGKGTTFYIKIPV